MKSSKGKERESSVDLEDLSEDEFNQNSTIKSDSDSEDGIAQFEDDEDVGMDSDDYDEETALGKQLSSIPFGSLLKAKKKLAKSALQSQQELEDAYNEEGEFPNNSRGIKANVNKSGGIGLPGQGRRANGSLKKADRASKHAPMEMTSKRAVGRSRTIVETQADKARDPRFDSLSGNFKPDLFRTSYAFLAEAQATELKTLRKTAIAARKNVVLPEEEKEAIEAALVRMESREVSRRTKEREGDAMVKWKKEESKKREDGKKEFYLKKGEQKQVILQAKYDTLSKDKKLLRKTVEKKRRTTAQKEKKLMPAKRKQ